VRFLLGYKLDACSLFMVSAVVAHPGVAEDLVAKAFFITRLLGLEVILSVFAILGDFETMGRGSQPHDRAAAVEVGIDMLHLVIGEIQETSEDHHEVGFFQRFETFNIRCPCGDLTFFVHAEKHGGFETVVLSEDASERGAGFLGAVFVVGSDENDVLTLAWSGFSFVGYLSCKGKYAEDEE